jgi:membrane-bound inhibitor of C-type lysozyme
MRIRFAAAFCLLLLLTAQPAPAASGSSPAADQPSAVYRTEDGRRLTARFDIPGRTVRITLPGGQTLTLPLAVSASGARYSDGASTFWEHHGRARFERGDVVIFEGECVLE